MKSVLTHCEAVEISPTSIAAIATCSVMSQSSPCLVFRGYPLPLESMMGLPMERTVCGYLKSCLWMYLRMSIWSVGVDAEARRDSR